MTAAVYRMPKPCDCAICTSGRATERAVFDALVAGGLEPDRANRLAEVAYQHAMAGVKAELQPDAASGPPAVGMVH